MTGYYYEDDHVSIYHGDCTDVLPWMEGLDVGAVLTSPPYNLGTPAGRGFGHYSDTAALSERGGNTTFSALDDGYDTHDDAMPHDEYVVWQQQVLRLLWATLADDGAIFYNHKPRVGGNSVRLPLDLIPDEIPLRQIITWDRGCGFTRTFAHFVPAYEWILLLAKPAFRTTTRSVDDVWRIPPETGSEHPAPFPLRLARTAIAATSAELVLDPFCGSGTTLRAAKDCGRRALGIEASERYCEIAAKRCAQEVLTL